VNDLLVEYLMENLFTQILVCTDIKKLKCCELLAS
jgi:hypothetical protein